MLLIRVLAVATCFLVASSADEVLDSPSVSMLNSYVAQGQQWASRGTWYNILEWAARSNSCLEAADSVACMACSQSMPAYAAPAGVGPIAVSNELWFKPERASVCGMCLKVSLPPGTASPECQSNSQKIASCPGSGAQPYTSVDQPWAWNAKLYPADSKNPYPYFIAVIIEWFDRNQTLPYAVTYPTQNVTTTEFGTWPIIYEGIDCPTGSHKLQYHIQNVSTVAGTPGNELCDNQLSAPCGTVEASTPAFKYLSFKAIGERIPLAAVQVRLFPDSDWLDMARSGADYWQIIDYSTVPKELNPADPLDFKLTCSDGTILTEPGLVPADMFCNFQDPACKYHTGTVQC